MREDFKEHVSCKFIGEREPIRPPNTDGFQAPWPKKDDEADQTALDLEISCYIPEWDKSQVLLSGFGI